MEKNKLGDFVEVTVAFPSNRRGPGVGPIENCTISVNLRKSYALNPSGPVGSVLRCTHPNAICIPNRTGTSAKTHRCADLRK